MIRFRRFVSFAILLPIWPIALIAAIVDDEAEASEIIDGLKTTWRRINEKR